MNPVFNSRKGSDHLFGIAVVLAALVAVGTISKSPWASSTTAAQSGGEPSMMSSPETALALGFSPDALVAGGCEADDAQALLAFLAEKPEDMAALAEARAALDSARQDLNEAKAILWSGGATEQRLAEVEEAESQLAAAQSAHESARTELREPVLEFLADRIGPEGAALAQQFQANRDRPVAEHVKALDLPANQWGLVKAAWLRVQRDQPIPPGMQSALAAAQSDPVASLVEARLVTNGSIVEAIFEENLLNSTP